MGALNLSCGATENAGPGSVNTTGTRTSTEDGSGGGLNEPVSPNGASGGSGGGLDEPVSPNGVSAGSGGAPAADTEGTTTSSNLAGAPGTAGAGPDERDPLTCGNFPHEDLSDGCEPKLRAILSSRDDHPLLTFEYDDAGRLATVGGERSHASYFRHRYGYDDQGRPSRIESDCDPEYGVRNVPHTEVTYDYGDDDVLDSVVREQEDDYVSYSYEVEDGRVRVESVNAEETYEYVIFDDFGRPAFSYLNVQADDPSVTGYVDGMAVFSGWENWATPVSRYAIQAPKRLFPYQPLDLTENDIDDFSYAHEDRVPFARRVSFAKDGLLERWTLSWGPSLEYTVTIDTERCGSVVLETTRFPNYDDPGEEVIVYYYGCDDFVLPTPLPEL